MRVLAISLPFVTLDFVLQIEHKSKHSRLGSNLRGAFLSRPLKFHPTRKRKSSGRINKKEHRGDTHSRWLSPVVSFSKIAEALVTVTLWRQGRFRYLRLQERQQLQSSWTHGTPELAKQDTRPACHFLAAVRACGQSLFAMQ